MVESAETPEAASPDPAPEPSAETPASDPIGPPLRRRRRSPRYVRWVRTLTPLVVGGLAGRLSAGVISVMELQAQRADRPTGEPRVQAPSAPGAGDGKGILGLYGDNPTLAGAVGDLMHETGKALGTSVQTVAAAVKQAFDAPGIMIAQLNGPAAGQTVFHMHFHILPRHEGLEFKMHARDMEDMAVLEAHAERVRACL